MWFNIYLVVASLFWTSHGFQIGKKNLHHDLLRQRQEDTKISLRHFLSTKQLEEDLNTNILNDVELPSAQWFNSHIQMIKCRNLGGMMKNMDGVSTPTSTTSTPTEQTPTDEIIVDIVGSSSCPNLIAITGETGSGKSLLITKAIEMILGSKVSSTLVPSDKTFASSEIVMRLSQPHLSVTNHILKELNMNSCILSPDSNGLATLELKRTISLVPGSKDPSKVRLKSLCEVNGKQVTLKSLRAISSPLITIVDAAVASSALSQRDARMSIIDTGVPTSIKSRVNFCQKKYSDLRYRRETLEKKLENKVVSSLISSSSDGVHSEEDLKLLRHWIEELDAFEARIQSFQSSLSSRSLEQSHSNNSSKIETSILQTLQKLINCFWSDEQATTNENIDVDVHSSLYTLLMDLKNEIIDLDSQIESARSSCEVLTSLSSQQSAAYYLQQCRNLLFDATKGFDDGNGDAGNTFVRSAEKSHELLNEIEDKVNEFARFMEDDSNGFLSKMEKLRSEIVVSLEDIDILLTDWSALARKHRVAPQSLPLCHHSLREELDGNIESRSLLPKAKEREQEALEVFEEACEMLTESRLEICKKLSRKVSDSLPSLGMDGSMFDVSLISDHSCTDASVYRNGKMLGVDSVDFFLNHSQESDNDSADDAINENHKRGGKLELVGSSGEKARILLAIETNLPGAVGASCGYQLSLLPEEGDQSLREHYTHPVTVVYDEIDAHVGGRAVVALSKLLIDQTRSKQPVSDENFENDSNGRKSQVISITHSQSIAAAADIHIVIQKSISTSQNDGRAKVLVECVDGDSRRMELARMTSGDLANDEAQKLADALLRHASEHKFNSTFSAMDNITP